MTTKPKYTDPIGYPDLTDMFVQRALRLAAGGEPNLEKLGDLRLIYLELAGIHKEEDPDKLLVKLGFAVAE